MLCFGFSISWPTSARFANVKSWHGSTPVANKHWELQFLKTNDILCLDFSFTTRSEVDHAGLRIELGLAGFAVHFHVYDSGHREQEESGSIKHTLWQAEFSNFDQDGNKVVMRKEICYSVFEAEQLVEDNKHRYDLAVIIPGNGA